MKLKDFLHYETNARELCVIRQGGWIVASCWIDYEDLFYIPHRLADNRVLKDEWDYLSVVNENNAAIKIPCHYVDIE